MKSSPLLFLLPCLLFTSCRNRPRGDGPEGILVPGWFSSSYRLTQQENTRLRNEARSAQQDGNREICGALLLPSTDSGALELVFADNESQRSHSYEISARSVRLIRELARARESDLVGSFHSHPSSDAAPSRGDLAAAGVNSLILIHSVPTGQTRLWRVLLRGGKKKAREVQLAVMSRRLGGPLPMAPSPGADSKHPFHDLRTR